MQHNSKKTAAFHITKTSGDCNAVLKDQQHFLELHLEELKAIKARIKQLNH